MNGKRLTDLLFEIQMSMIGVEPCTPFWRLMTEREKEIWEIVASVVTSRIQTEVLQAKMLNDLGLAPEEIAEAARAEEERLKIEHNKAWMIAELAKPDIVLFSSQQFEADMRAATSK